MLFKFGLYSKNLCLCLFFLFTTPSLFSSLPPVLCLYLCNSPITAVISSINLLLQFPFRKLALHPLSFFHLNFLLLTLCLSFPLYITRAPFICPCFIPPFSFFTSLLLLFFFFHSLKHLILREINQICVCPTQPMLHRELYKLKY